MYDENFEKKKDLSSIILFDLVINITQPSWLTKNNEFESGLIRPLIIYW